MEISNLIYLQNPYSPVSTKEFRTLTSLQGPQGYGYLRVWILSSVDPQLSCSISPFPGRQRKNNEDHTCGVGREPPDGLIFKLLFI
jgi:hypothetical protein